MRISNCNNIRDTFCEPETIGTINDYERYVDGDVMLKKLKNPKMDRIDAYVKCKYVGSVCETSEVVTKKVEILYLKDWKDHTSYIDIITYWYDEYRRTKKIANKERMCDIVDEYLAVRWNHKDVWEIVSVDNVKIERL